MKKNMLLKVLGRVLIAISVFANIVFIGGWLLKKWLAGNTYGTSFDYESVMSLQYNMGKDFELLENRGYYFFEMEESLLMDCRAYVWHRGGGFKKERYDFEGYGLKYCLEKTKEQTTIINIIYSINIPLDAMIYQTEYSNLKEYEIDEIRCFLGVGETNEDGSIYFQIDDDCFYIEVLREKGVMLETEEIISIVTPIIESRYILEK